MNRWVWVIGEAAGLRWVVENETMAFADHAAGRIRPMAAGDTAVLYVTRGAHHNPTRDVARLAGIATVVGHLAREPKPIEIAVQGMNVCAIPNAPVHAGISEGQALQYFEMINRLRVEQGKVESHQLILDLLL